MRDHEEDRKSQLTKLAAFCPFPDNVKALATNHEELRAQYKSIVDVIAENNITVPFLDFVQICGRIVVTRFPHENAVAEILHHLLLVQA